jgi:hypothetical protein
MLQASMRKERGKASNLLRLCRAPLPLPLHLPSPSRPRPHPHHLRQRPHPQPDPMQPLEPIWAVEGMAGWGELRQAGVEGHAADASTANLKQKLSAVAENVRADRDVLRLLTASTAGVPSLCIILSYFCGLHGPVAMTGGCWGTLLLSTRMDAVRVH